MTEQDIAVIDAMFRAKRIIIDLAFEVLEQEKQKHKTEERSERDEARIEGMRDLIDILVNGQEAEK